MNIHDPFLVMRDLPSYIACQERIGEDFHNRDSWSKKAILNVARMGKFSTDRTIRQYAQEIWGMPLDG